MTPQEVYAEALKRYTEAAMQRDGMAMAGGATPRPMAPMPPSSGGSPLSPVVAMGIKKAITDSLAAPAASPEILSAAWGGGGELAAPQIVGAEWAGGASQLPTGAAAMPWANGGLGVLGGAGLVAGGTIAAAALGKAIMKQLQKLTPQSHYHRPYSEEIDLPQMSTQVKQFAPDATDDQIKSVLERARAEGLMAIPSARIKDDQTFPGTLAVTNRAAFVNPSKYGRAYRDTYKAANDMHGTLVSSEKRGGLMDLFARTQASRLTPDKNPYAMSPDQFLKFFGDIAKPSPYTGGPVTFGGGGTTPAPAPTIKMTLPTPQIDQDVIEALKRSQAKANIMSMFGGGD